MPAPAVAGLARAAMKAYPMVQKFAKGVGAASDLLQTLGKSADDTAKKIIHFADNLGMRWIKMQDMAFKTARTMAMSREEALRYNESLIKSTKELASQYGISARELNDFQKTYSESVGRNIILTRQQMANMSALSKITDNATAGQLVDEFDKLGVGIAGATAKVGLMQERAKYLGINATKATKALKDNIRLAASYSFRNGVNDIEKMALRATSIRMDMNAITSAMDKFQDIESAIKTSANLQMLGGSFAAQFSNPMGAMYESLADPEAFMKRIEKTISGKGRYDEKTGAVQFDPVTLMQLREAAKQLGMSVEQLTTPAMAKVQEEKVMQEFARNANKNGFSEADKAAIKNLARTNVDEKTGKHYVTLLNENGEPEQKFVEDLTREQLKVAQDTQMTEEGLFNDVQDIKTILERVHGRARDTKSLREAEEGMQTWWDAFVTNLQDIYMPFISGGYNKASNWLGKQYYANGGIVKPIPHAADGMIIPGNSYYGDKVPAMVNSGEMVLNQKQQKSMFNLLSSLAVTGGSAYGMNKLGGRIGYGSLGSTMLLANMLGGGKTDMTSLIEAHFVMKAVKNLKPLKTSITQIGNVSETAAKSTTTFGANWKELTNTMSKDWNNLSRRISITSRRYFTTRKWGKVTGAVGKLSSKAASLGHLTAAQAKVIGEHIGKYTVKPIANGAKWLANTKPVINARGWADMKMLRAKLGYRDLVKPKAQEYSRLIKNLFNDGSAAQASKAASRLQTPEIAMTGRSTGISNIAETASKETSSIAKGSKVLSGLGKAGKMIGKKLPYIGAALAVGSAIGGIAGASSQYDAQVDEIERSGMSERDKARAKDRATKQKNANIGGSVGSAAGGLGGMAAGAAAGAAIGSVVPIVGTAIGGLIGGALGAWGGEALGGSIGKGIGGLFGGNEEEKYIEEQKENAKAIAGNNEQIIKILKSIEGKMPGSSPIASNFGLKPLEMAGSVMKSLPIFGPMLKVAEGVGGALLGGAGANVGPAEIKLNVSGTIKLEGAGKAADFDFNKLLDNPEFKRKLTEVITERIRTEYNGGVKKGGNGRDALADKIAH